MKKRKMPFIAVVICAVVLMISVSAIRYRLRPQQETGMVASHVLRNSYNGYQGSWGEADDWNVGGQDASERNRGAVNTQVSQDAREKMTMLRGDGTDVVTIMVYMCGSDLESEDGMATADLQEMMAADSSDNINLLVYTGGCKNWQNNVISSRTNQVFQVKNGGLVSLIGDVGSKSMTDPDTLSQYIRWAKKKFPADRYELILWDRGGGSAKGFGYDENFAEDGSMTLEKLRKALKDGGCTFDFVGFDAGLMATLETAWMVQPYADYLIASEETEPGAGWYYTGWLSRLSENPSMSTLEIGKYIADDYINVCSAKAPGQSCTLSVTDLGELYGTVPKKFQAFARSVSDMIRSGEFRHVSEARNRTKEFAKEIGMDQVDLIHLAENMETTEGWELSDVLQNAVKYCRTSQGVRNAYGISIYFPYRQLSFVSEVTELYRKCGWSEAYIDCIQSFATLQAAGQMLAGGETQQQSSLFLSLLTDGQGHLASVPKGEEEVSQLLGQLSEGENVDSLGLNEKASDFIDTELLDNSREYLTENRFDASALLWSDKNGEEVLKLEESQWELIQEVELHIFANDGSGYLDLGRDHVYQLDEEGDLKGFYDGTWVGLDGEIAAYDLISAEGNDEEYEILGRVPVMLNEEKADLILCFSSEKPAGQVLGASMCYTRGETDTVRKGLRQLKDGDRLQLICDYYTYDKKMLTDHALGNPITVQGELQVENIYMDGMKYKAVYRLTDIYNNHYWTPAADTRIKVW